MFPAKLKAIRLYLFLCLFVPISTHGSPINSPQPIGGYHSDNVWKNLIYFHDGEFKILNKKFLFSFDNPSPSLEKKLTIRAINNNTDIACRFPARYSYLLKQGLITTKVFDCPYLEEYKDKVAADKFYYIFASKNYTSITSMMGHGMIAAEGTTPSGEKTSHAYSFFADLSDSNLPALLYKSFIGGMDGALILRPLRSELDRYLIKEGRELWQLELKLPKDKRELLKMALWELKNVEPRYLFHTFNCATLLHYTLAIVAPETLNHSSLFTTPLDIYRSLQQEDYINHIQIRYAENTIEKLGANHHSVQPTAELQDSSVGLYIKDGLHLTYMAASHSYRTPQVRTVSQTALKIGAIDLNLSKGKIKELTLYEYLDLAIEPSISSHFFIGASQNDYHSHSKMIIGSSISAGKTWHYGNASLSILSGLRVQAKDLFNPLLEGYLSYKINDYTTLTSTANFQTNFRENYYKIRSTLNRRIGKNHVVFLGAETAKPRMTDNLFFAGLNYHF